MDNARDSENDSADRRQAGEEEVPLSRAARIRSRLVIVAGYMMDGVIPLMAVSALIVAVMAFNGNKSGQAMVGQTTSRLDNMNVSLTASRGELEKLRGSMLKDKVMLEDEHKKLDERLVKVVQAISQLQAIAKISPTLNEQVSQATATPSAATAATIVPPATGDVIKPGAGKKSGDQATVLKEAVEKFNKK